MRKGFLGSLAGVLAGAGLALAQQAPAFRPARDFSFPPAAPVSAPAAYALPPQYVAVTQYQQYPQYPAYPPPQYGAIPWGYPASAPMMVAPSYPASAQQVYTRPASVAAQVPQPLPAAPAAQFQEAPALAQTQPPATPEPARPPKQPEPIPPPKDSAERIAPPAEPDSVPLATGLYPGSPDDCDAEEGPPATEEGKSKKGKKEKKEKKDHEQRFWAGLDYLYWRVQNGPLPVPLVTSGSTILIGPAHDVDYNDQSGIRASAGYWVQPYLGVEVGGFILEKGHKNFAEGSTGATVLARPFFNTLTGAPDMLLIAAPGTASGTIDVRSSSQLFGTEANLLVNAYRGCKFGINLIGGFRFVDLQEDLNVTQVSQLLGPAGRSFGGMGLGAGSRLLIADALDTHNQFYGGQIGVQSGLQMGRLFLGTTAKYAIGMTHQLVSATGNTTLLDTGAVLPGGLLVLPSNSGRHVNDAFTMLPEGSFEIGLKLTDRVNLSLGYSFLYWTRVVRPGDQLNQTVNPTQLPTSPAFVTANMAAQPSLVLTDRSFWAQGFSAGLAFRY